MVDQELQSATQELYDKVVAAKGSDSDDEMDKNDDEGDDGYETVSEEDISNDEDDKMKD